MKLGQLYLQDNIDQVLPSANSAGFHLKELCTGPGLSIIISFRCSMNGGSGQLHTLKLLSGAMAESDIVMCDTRWGL